MGCFVMDARNNVPGLRLLTTRQKKNDIKLVAKVKFRADHRSNRYGLLPNRQFELDSMTVEHVTIFILMCRYKY